MRMKFFLTEMDSVAERLWTKDIDMDKLDRLVDYTTSKRLHYKVIRKWESRYLMANRQELVSTQNYEADVMGVVSPQ